MRLIGIPNSPYVRRVAISLEMLGIEFEREDISAFGEFEKFQRVNPAVKAPTLVLDNGAIVLDSSLILQFAESELSEGKTLWPKGHTEIQQDFSALSMALAACEKNVQLVYELNLRPESARYEKWIERVTVQMTAAYQSLEKSIKNRTDAFSTGHSQAAITSAVVWFFTQSTVPDKVKVADHPSLAALSDRLESLPAFKKFTPPAIQK